MPRSLLDDMDDEDNGVSLLDELANTPEEEREYLESEPWRPEAGDAIEGVVIDRYRFDTDYSEDVPGMVLEVAGEDVPWSVAGLHKVLRDLIEEHNPQKGDRVAIICVGERETRKVNAKGKPQTFMHYRMAVRRGAGGRGGEGGDGARRSPGSNGRKGGSTGDRATAREIERPEKVDNVTPARKPASTPTRKPGQGVTRRSARELVSDAPDY